MASVHRWQALYRQHPIMRLSVVRTVAPVVEVWPIQLWEKLPVLPVPLLDPDPDIPLDLGTVVAAVYERGAYARLIDYRLPPPPPALSEAEAAWLDKYLRAQQVR